MGTPLQHLGRLSRRPRWTAGFLLWAYAWASLLGGLHFALEAHSVCSHGQLTHGEHACATEEGETSTPERVAEAPDPERTGGHAHCEWVGRACPERAAQDAHGAPAAPHAAAPVAEPCVERARSRVPVLALAPHHGPPRPV